MAPSSTENRNSKTKLLFNSLLFSKSQPERESAEGEENTKNVHNLFNWEWNEMHFITIKINYFKWVLKCFKDALLNSNFNFYGLYGLIAEFQDRKCWAVIYQFTYFILIFLQLKLLGSYEMRKILCKNLFNFFRMTK